MLYLNSKHLLLFSFFLSIITRAHDQAYPSTIQDIPMNFIRQYLPDNPVIVEAGAHRGHETLVMAQDWKPCTIHAFEPIPLLFSHLQNNVGSYNNVNLYPLALSDQNGTSIFYVSSGQSDGSSSLLKPKDHLIDHPYVYFNETITVMTKTLDSWAQENNIEKVDFLWLDMQGCELAMMKASPTIMETVQAIYTEVSHKELYEGCPVYPEVRTWLEEQGFTMIQEALPTGWNGGNVLFVRSKEKKVASAPRLLIKIPTRSRPEKFFQTLDKHYEFLSGEIPYEFLISCDADDATMNNPTIIDRLKNYPHLSFSFCLNKSKVAAYNRDINRDVPFDIVLVSSDDMLPCCKGYDKIIAHIMLAHFPDFDGVLNFHDGVVGGTLNTLPVIGKKFFDRFGYIYNPSYSSLFCDNELTMVSRILKKEKIIDLVIIRHMHPCHGFSPWDDLYVYNESLHAKDCKTFQERAACSFDLNGNSSC